MILRIDVTAALGLTDGGGSQTRYQFSFVRATYGATVTDNLSSTTARKVERAWRTATQSSPKLASDVKLRRQQHGSHEKKRARNIRASLRSYTTRLVVFSTRRK